MRYDLRELSLPARYKILNSTVTPRPIAWVTSVSHAGVVNAAPYSFFNVCGVEPPLVVLGLLKDLRTRKLKNTATNIIDTGEFVVNLVCEADAPHEVSEIDYADIETIPSEAVRPPRIATSPVSFECRKVAALDIGTHQTVMIGEILVAHIADAFISDPEKLYLDTSAMGLIGRTHGAGWYARTTDQFKLDRPAFDPERVKPKGEGA